jgi:hypothetical protein
MTQSNLLTLAKQGDAKAIADVISYLMQTEGVITKAALKDGFLEIIVEADQVPDQQQSLTHIHKIINYLQPKFINKIRVCGLFGAVTGIGGLAALPIAIPTNIYASWRIQAATIRAIAYVYGYPPSKTDTCLVLFGAVDSQMQALKRLGIEAAKVATKKAVDQYMTKEIIKSVLKLSLKEAATKMAQKAIVTKIIPVVGAPIGFGFDWMTTQAVGKLAIKYYSGT